MSFRLTSVHPSAHDASAPGAGGATTAAGAASAWRAANGLADPAPSVSPGATPAALLGELRASAPLVQCITNSVVTGFTANVLLAAGASPAMVDIPVESGLFARVASGLLINLGTPRAEQRAAAIEAATAANEAGTPWVLDPVAIGVLPVRTALAAELLALRPTIVRGNASEIVALAGLGAGGRGTDSTASPEDALEAALSIARATDGAVAVSGPVDLVTDGARVVRIANGDALLTRVTGGGCALGALIAASAASTVGEARDRTGATPLDAAVAASVVYGIAAERAAAAATGPGSFAVGLLDALDAVTAGTVEALELVGVQEFEEPAAPTGVDVDRATAGAVA